MTCRAACVPPWREPLVAVYIERAETGRWDDFRWLAESQGLTTQRAVELWEGLRARRHAGATGAPNVLRPSA
jgi:hypothetical protein